MGDSMTQSYKKPADNIFTDDTDHWLLFREKRFAVAGDGEYAVLKGLNLSGLELSDFVAAWLAFVDCKLDNTSFRDTDFAFNATFMNCSMKNVDFTGSFGADDLFYKCDLSGATFDKSAHWASVDLDGNKIASYFVDCVLSEELRNYLVSDGNVVAKGEISVGIQQQLREVIEAPVIDI